MAKKKVKTQKGMVKSIRVVKQKKKKKATKPKSVKKNRSVKQNKSVNLKKATKKNQTLSKLLYWLPRILGIIFAIFISIFALDVFGEGLGFWKTIIALFIHLLPTFLAVIALLIAWHDEPVGGGVFIVLGLLYIFLFLDQASFSSYLLIAGPVFLIGILFLLDWFFRKRNV